MILKPGDIVRVLLHMLHVRTESDKWILQGPLVDLNKNCVLELVEVRDTNNQRFWCPSIGKFISSLHQAYNTARFEKISR